MGILHSRWWRRPHQGPALLRAACGEVAVCGSDIRKPPVSGRPGRESLLRSEYQPGAWRAAVGRGGNEARGGDALLGGGTGEGDADAGPRQPEFESAP